MQPPEFAKRISAEVVQALREHRIARGMSLSRLAEKSGLSIAMVHYVERGARNPTFDTLLRMSAALNLDLAALLRRAVAKRTRPVDS